jgi:hypothetical protein
MRRKGRDKEVENEKNKKTNDSRKKNNKILLLFKYRAFRIIKLY